MIESFNFLTAIENRKKQAKNKLQEWKHYLILGYFL